VKFHGRRRLEVNIHGKISESIAVKAHRSVRMVPKSFTDLEFTKVIGSVADPDDF
jgi:hypothetical protein